MACGERTYEKTAWGNKEFYGSSRVVFGVFGCFYAKTKNSVVFYIDMVYSFQIGPKYKNINSISMCI